jgi:hypothetical protein
MDMSSTTTCGAAGLAGQLVGGEVLDHGRQATAADGMVVDDKNSDVLHGWNLQTLPAEGRVFRVGVDTTMH